MRDRAVIEHCGTRPDILSLEVLLDIRDLMVKSLKATKTTRKPRKPRKTT